MHLLGEGGMGEVRLCRDRRIGREVAMKVLRPGAGSRSDARARFEREARVQGQLEHPTVVPIYDLGVRPAGAAFFTMKRLRGKTLAQVIESLRAGEPDAVAAHSQRKLIAALSSVCLGVAFAHARGVLHRDLKPSNVMLGAFGEVHVLDWGLAKVAGAPDPISVQDPTVDAANIVRAPLDEPGASFTEAGVIMGTPGYMSPEQVRGEELDGRADVFAIGAMLFEVLTLQPLVPRGPTQEAMLAATVDGPDNHPATRCSDVSPELDEICAKATSTRAEDRFASARALHQALERHLEGHRDQEKRRELADRHAASAKDAVARLAAASGGGAAERSTAMRELGAALALVPEHPTAMETLLHLLLDAPTSLPPEAKAELEAVRLKQHHAVRHILPIGYVFWLIATLPLALLGVRSPTLFVLECGLILASIVSSWWAARRPEERLPSLVTYLCTAGAVAALSTYLGPLIMVPTVATLLTAIFMTYGPRSELLSVTSLLVLAVLAPLGLELAGALPPSYLVSEDHIVVLANMTRFPGTGMLVYWALSNLVCLLAPVIFVLRARNTFDATEERLFAHTWHLRQLVPDKARAVAAG
jgi:serine/threonine-protein kinase